MSLYLEDPGSIGDLEEEWNSFDRLNEQTKLLHSTGRWTQPWKTGLPIDFTPKHPPKALPKKWGIIPRPWIANVKAFLAGKRYHPMGFYQKHPDPRQEEFFFQLFNECIAEGVLTEAFIQSEIRKKHIRPDAMTVARQFALAV